MIFVDEGQVAGYCGTHRYEWLGNHPCPKCLFEERSRMKIKVILTDDLPEQDVEIEIRSRDD